MNELKILLSLIYAYIKFSSVSRSKTETTKQPETEMNKRKKEENKIHLKRVTEENGFMTGCSKSPWPTGNFTNNLPGKKG